MITVNVKVFKSHIYGIFLKPDFKLRREIIYFADVEAYFSGQNYVLFVSFCGNK
jgi:hypothetical protein